MKLLFSTCFCLCLCISCLPAQILFQENFETPGIPTGWSVQSSASDGGWIVGTPNALSSQSFGIPSNGSQRVAATNDDKCNCIKSQDYLITPPLDLSAVNQAVLKADILFGRKTYDGLTEVGTIEVSLDNINWTVVNTLSGHNGWASIVTDLGAYVGNSAVYVAFHYNDNNGWLYGMAVDNVVLEEPPGLDAALLDLNARIFGQENVSFPVAGSLFNNGTTVITDLEISYTVNGGTPVVGVSNGLNIAAFSSFNFQHPTDWLPTTGGVYMVEVAITAVNGVPDENPDNNKLTFETEIYPHVVPPNRVDEFLAASPVFETIATAANKLDKPTDLDFFPILGKNELWVINERNEDDGGSTLTIYDPGTPDQTFLHRVDGNAWHFMSLPTGIAFGDNFNFASSPGVKDANHSNGTFTGPTLWSSDPDIYAMPSGGNGSHLDMLHGSPYSMGIAHEVDNVYWIFDGWNETLVRYDFQEDHGPGNDDHSDAIVRRYTEIKVKADRPVPSHMVLDKTSGWLYVVDNGNDRVLRVDINSGQVGNNIPLINEALAEHKGVNNVTWEVIINQGLSRPSGIEIIENRLLVSDYATGDIVVYDIENSFVELGRFATGQPGITGLKIGPDGAIWYTNRTLNMLRKVTPGEVSATGSPELAAQVRLMPNPTTGFLRVQLPDQTTATLTLNDFTGKQLQVVHNAIAGQQLDLSAFPKGVYVLTIASASYSTTRKVILAK
jgi:hypothetical protein